MMLPGALYYQGRLKGRVVNVLFAWMELHQCTFHHPKNWCTCDTVAGDVVITPPEVEVDSNREIVFAERAEAPTATVRIRLQPSSGAETVVVLDGFRAEVWRGRALDGEVAVDLGPGLYKALVEGTGREALFEVVARETSITL